MEKLLGVFILSCISYCGVYGVTCDEEKISSTYCCLQENMSACLHAPWREQLFEKNIAKEHVTCPFCTELHAHLDECFLVLYRSSHSAVVLNPYPYSKGHMLIIPYEHTGDLNMLSQETRADMIELSAKCVHVLEFAYDIQGANVGFNLGKEAGASIPDHIHMHIVPRTMQPSFIYTIGNTNVASWDMKVVYNELKKLF